MTLEVDPRRAQFIGDSVQGSPLWKIDFQSLVRSVTAAPAGAPEQISSIDGQTGSVSSFCATFLAALVQDNSAADLLAFGEDFISRLASERNVAGLVQLTNGVFKSFALQPAGEEMAARKRCAEVNHRLHAFANAKLLELQRDAPGYRVFSNYIDDWWEASPKSEIANALCFVFLTDSYFDAFVIWLDVFHAATRDSLQLLVVGFGPDLCGRITGKLDEAGVRNAIVMNFGYGGPVSVCGNGRSLSFLWYFKVSIVCHLLQDCGASVIYSDLDTYWMKNFFELWRSQQNSDQPSISFMPTFEMPWHARAQWGHIPCAGFFACNGGPDIAQFVSEWKSFVELMFDDQIGLSEMLLRQQVVWDAGGGTFDWRYTHWTSGSNKSVRISLMKPSAAVRTSAPDLKTIGDAIVWHPRWTSFREASAGIAATLVSLAHQNFDRETIESSTKDGSAVACAAPNQGASPPMSNLALNKPALQSSTSPWSVGRAPSDDAKGANNGDLSRETGFHTATEQDPWWQVDLGDEFLIQKVVIVNRRHMAHRLRHFSLLKSLDGEHWTVFFRKVDGAVFGDIDDEPYTAEISGDHVARFIRVRLDGRDCLHFRECQVFGTSPDPATRERLISEAAQAAEAQASIPAGRNGYLAKVGDFAVFVDTSNYAAGIVKALSTGVYEGRERRLVQQTVQPGDRIVEVGTAIGLVSMTAASIVGAKNVRTFDANPDIVADAQANFRRNGLQDILSHHGVLKNKLAIAGQNEFVDFYIDKAFWASRLNASLEDPGIVGAVKVPVFCLEEQIRAHGATVLICDIEGGEVDLLTQADLSGIHLIIMETHYWSAGEAPTDAMIRKLVLDDFSIHLDLSGHQVLVLRRSGSEQQTTSPPLATARKKRRFPWS